MNVKNVPYLCADIATFKHSAREKLNQAYITIQNSPLVEEVDGLTE